jgi:pilus assembly protein CpaC
MTNIHNSRHAKARGLLLLGTAALAFGCGGMASTPAQAEPQNQVIQVSATKSKSVKVAKGKPQAISTSAAFYEIVVGDPEVANVNPLTDKSFYILGNKLGTTGIALFDENKILVGTIDVEVTLDTQQLASTINNTVPESNIKVGSANGRVVLSGKAKDSVDAEKAQKIAKNFSGEEEIINSVSIGSSQQVQLNVRFVEIKRTAGNILATRIGGSYSFGDNTISFNSNPGNIARNSTNSLIGSLVSGGLSIDATIRALEDNKVARSLAEPNLVARSGEEASFLAGGEIPIPVAADDNKITYEFKKVGISLRFKPTVLKDGLISLDMEPEVSALDYSQSFPVGDFNLPAFSVRRAKTSIELKSGQSFMVAGLLATTNDVTRENIPGTKNVPVLSNLAGSKDYQRRETELVIIVTPHLVQPVDPTKKLSTPLEKTVAGSPVDVILGDIDEIKVSDVDKAKSTSAKAAANADTAAGHFLELGE